MEGGRRKEGRGRQDEGRTEERRNLRDKDFVIVLGEDGTLLLLNSLFQGKGKKDRGRRTEGEEAGGREKGGGRKEEGGGGGGGRGRRKERGEFRI
jgi:hypothetical protein